MRCCFACLAMALAFSLGGRAPQAFCADSARFETVRLHGLCVRQAPTSRSNIVRALRSGERVRVLDRKGDWVKVAADGGARGWVFGGCLTGFDIKAPALYASRLAPAKSGAAPQDKASFNAMSKAPAPAFSKPRPDKAPLDAYIDHVRLSGAVGSASSAKSFVSAASTMSGAPGSRHMIEIYLKEHRLYLYEKLPDGSRRLVRDYVVATPSAEVESPQGWGVVTGIDFDPWWIPTANMKRRARKKGRVLPNSVRPGIKSNPMGSFKIFLSHGFGYRIHGNNNPGSIGRPVTSGCIRMRNGEGEEMARMIEVGAEVLFF
jgi:lipoprotein-anchoring transpeptidase ErfK/SrfK